MKKIFKKKVPHPDSDNFEKQPADDIENNNKLDPFLSMQEKYRVRALIEEKFPKGAPGR